MSAIGDQLNRLIGTRLYDICEEIDAEDGFKVLSFRFLKSDDVKENGTHDLFIKLVGCSFRLLAGNVIWLNYEDWDDSDREKLIQKAHALDLLQKPLKVCSVAKNAWGDLDLTLQRETTDEGTGDSVSSEFVLTFFTTSESDQDGFLLQENDVRLMKEGMSFHFAPPCF